MNLELSFIIASSQRPPCVLFHHILYNPLLCGFRGKSISVPTRFRSVVERFRNSDRNVLPALVFGLARLWSRGKLESGSKTCTRIPADKGRIASMPAYRRGPSSGTKRQDSDASFPVLFDVTMQLVKIASPPQPRDPSSGKFVARPK